MIKPNTKVGFIPNHKPVLYGLFLISLVSIVLAFVISPNWGTSFQGGTSITIHFDRAIPAEKVRQEFELDPRFDIPTVQQIGNDADNRFVVRTRTTTTLNCAKFAEVRQKLDAEVAGVSQGAYAVGQWPACNPEKEDGIRGDFKVSLVTPDGKTLTEAPMDGKAMQDALSRSGLDALVTYEPVTRNYNVKPQGIQREVEDFLQAKFADGFDLSRFDAVVPALTPEQKLAQAAASSIDQIDTVGADVGEKFRTDAVVSILVALGLMLLYIGIRFDARYAPAAVISLTVTTLVTFGFVIVMRIEVTLETVAAFLSLVGYGINDTIVTFDRVRENVALAEPDEELGHIVNRAINECLSRTAITSITTLIAIVPMAILATGATRDFAIIMTVGIIVATFDSMFVSCPMFLRFDGVFKRAQERSRARMEIADLKENL